MSRATLILNGEKVRDQAVGWVRSAPFGTRVEFKHSKRSLPQNARFWAMLSDIATQVQWHGIWLTPADWKLMFMDALKREMRIVPNIDGNGFVNLGRSSSDLTKTEMGDLMELMAAWGAQHSVIFHGEKETEE